MNKPQQNCLPDSQLSRYAIGLLSAADSAAVEQHLATCRTCQKRLGHVDEADSILIALRDGRIGAQPPTSPQVGKLVAQLQDPSYLETKSRSLPETMPCDNAVVRVEDLLRGTSPPRSANEIARLGEFRLLQLLGEGGMGAVFLAEDTQLQRQIAIKLLKPALASDPAAVERFLREARAVAALKHDHIVTIYQVGHSGSVPFMAQELLKGETLEARLQRESILPIDEIVRIGREIAAGLAQAHSRGLLHRDIKPANIWLEETNHRVKILDFGLARLQTEEVLLTSRGVIMGTPAYMSPEQASGEAVDARTDLFSLGCVLYRMATGRLPFPGRNLLEILKAIASDIPPPAATLNPQVLPPLDQLIATLLAKSPDERWASADDVEQRLRTLEYEPGINLALRMSPKRKLKLAPRIAQVIIAMTCLLAVAAVVFRGRLAPTPLVDATNASARPLQAPSPAASPPSGKWIGATRWLERQSDGTWTEHDPSGQLRVWNERSRCADYVELHDPKQGTLARLSATNMYIKSKIATMFAPSVGGRWEHTPSGVSDRPAARWVFPDGRFDCDCQKIWTRYRNDRPVVSFFEVSRGNNNVEIATAATYRVRLTATDAQSVRGDPEAVIERLEGKWEIPPAVTTASISTWRINPVFASIAKPNPLPIAIGISRELLGMELWYVDGLKVVRGQSFATDRELTVEMPAGTPRSLDWTQSDAKLAVVVDDKLWTVAPDSGEKPNLVYEFKSIPHKCSVANNGSSIAWLDKTNLSSKVPELVVCNSNGSPRASLGKCYDPAWFADNRRLAYLAWEAKWKIAIWDGTKSDLIEVPIHSTIGVTPAPSPDGKTIAFAMPAADGSRQLGLLDLETRQPRQITNSGMWVSHPAFSPDGRFLAFIRQFDSNNGDLIVLNPETREETTIAKSVSGVRPAWRRKPIQVAPARSYSLRFDGIDDRVEIPFLSNDGAPHTLECWVKCEKHSLCSILTFSGTTYRSNFFHELTKSGFAGGNQRSGSYATDLHPLPAGWVHLAGTFDGQVATYFVNGKRFAANERWTNPPRGSGLVLGCLPHPTLPDKFQDHFSGLLDEFRLSQGIRYATDFLPPSRLTADADTLALYCFDEGKDEILKDSSGHDQHGMIKGATWLASDRITALQD